jgi:hypothetical protein
MIRDNHSNALLETDVLELQKYRKEKTRDRDLAQMKKDIMCIKESINNLTEIINRIESANG